MKAHVKTHNGTPTLFLDDKPAYANCMLLGGLDQNYRELNHHLMGEYAKAGVHIYSIDSVGPEWCGPRPGQAGHFDFTATAPRLQEVVDADPDALFLLRMGFETRWVAENWWNKLNPEEVEILSDGQRWSASFASSVWQDEVKALLTGYIDTLRSTGMYDRVIAYQIATGTCGEWIKDWSSMDLACGDFSEPMRRAFRGWLLRKYEWDVSRLQAAWAEPEVTFQNAEVPAAGEQMNTTHFLLRDPQKEQNVIDFYACYAEVTADALLGFCQTVKSLTGGDKLTGAFFGYLMDIAWNDSFFNNNYGEIANAEVATHQRSGHLGLQKLLRSPDIDFLVSPYGYHFRGIGGDGLAMQPSESLRVHNKLYLFEEDTLMHNNFDPQGRMHPFEQSIEIYKRNFAQVLTHGQGITWLETSAFMEYPGIVQEAHRWQKRYSEIGEWALKLDRTPAAEVAVLLDDESFFYHTNLNNVTLPLVSHQRVFNLNRFGAPHDVYLLNDLLEGRLPQYKLYIFLNAIHLNQQRRTALKEILRREGKTALWIWAPGYLNSDAVNPVDVENMSDLTGFTFGKGSVFWGPQMHITNFNHLITQGLSQDLFWGSTQPLGPLFHLQDPQATNLGEVIYSMGRCQPGFGVKTFPEEQAGAGGWNSVYIATPSVPAPVLRGIARYAGVHLYNEQGDVIYATPELLSIHTVAGGSRTFCLPRPVEVVYDLFNGYTLAQDANEFSTQLAPASTNLYFTGKAELLNGLPQF